MKERQEGRVNMKKWMNRIAHWKFDKKMCGDCTYNSDYAAGFNNINGNIDEKTVNGAFENTK